MQNELPIAIINSWLEMIENDELYSLSEENIVYMLTTIKEVLIEENQK